MGKDAREIIKNMLKDELVFMAKHALNTNKEQVKDILITRILQTFSKRGLTAKYGSGGTTYENIIVELKKTSVYKWAVIVDTATTEEEFIEFIKTEFDQSTASRILTHTWEDARMLYHIEWKFAFPFPKEKRTTAILRRKIWTKRTAPGQFIAPPPPVPEKPWIENIPEEMRHVIQIMSAEGTTPFQRELIKAILLNKFNENEVVQFTIQVRNQSKRNLYEMSIKKP